MTKLLKGVINMFTLFSILGLLGLLAFLIEELIGE